MMGPVRQIKVARECQGVRGLDVRVLVGRPLGQPGRRALLLSLVAQIDVGREVESRSAGVAVTEQEFHVQFPNIHR